MASVAIAVGVSVAATLITSALTPRPSNNNQLDDLSVLKSEYGVPLPIVWGKQRVTGNVFWGTGLERSVESSGGKGGGGSEGDTVTVRGTFAVMLTDASVRSIGNFGRIWLNNKLVYDALSTDPDVIEKNLEFLENATFYLGTDTQSADPTIISVEGAANTPAFRGRSYIVFNQLDLTDFGNVVPKVDVEILQDTGGVFLSEIIEDLCTVAGLPSTDYTINLTNNPTVTGFIFNQSGSTVRSSLEDLQNIHLFQIIDNGSQIIFQDQEQPLSASINATQLNTRLSGNEVPIAFEEVVEKKEDLPSKLEIEYDNVNKDYERGVQDYYQARARHVNDVSFKTKSALSDSEAQTAARRLSEIYWSQDKRYEKVMIPYVNNNLIAGATVRLNALGVNRVCQVEKIVRGTNFIAEVTLIASSNNILNVISNSDLDNLYNPPVIEDVNTEPTAIVVDTNLLSDIDNSVGVYASVIPDDIAWFGGSLEATPQGGSFTAIANLPTEAVRGQLTTELLETRPHTIDQGGSFRVTLDFGTLASATDLEFQNFTYFMYVDGEVINVKNATLVATDTYEITEYVRGVRGTETFTTTHPIGSTVYLIKGGTSFVDASGTVDDLGDNLEFKAVPTGQVSTTVNNITTLTPFEATRLKPYAPSFARISLQTSTNDLVITFERRSRLEGQWLEASETVPLNETVEDYDVEVYNTAGTVLINTYSVSSTVFVYTSAQQTNDFGGNVTEVNMVIYQKSSVVGRGYPYNAGLVSVSELI